MSKTGTATAALEQTEINQILNAYLDCKAAAKKANDEAKELQEKIDEYAGEHISEFVEGELVLEDGKISIRNNPPKLTHVGSGKALSSAEREELAAALKEDYLEIKPNIKKIQARVNGDKVLKKYLEAKGVTVEQDQRYAVSGY